MNYNIKYEISRVDPSVSKATKKYGTVRYMNFPTQAAFDLFKEQNQEIGIKSSTFSNLRPKNVRSVLYCLNVQIKANLLSHSSKNATLPTNEYDMYDNLICEKGDAEFRNLNCIYKS